MGEPDSNRMDMVTRVAIGALGPDAKVPAKLLRETGLHREMIREHFAALAPEIKYLVGWKQLRDYDYPTRWYDSTEEDRRNGEKMNGRWQSELESSNLGHEMAVLIYDGGYEGPSAPKYRLFLLRDGRLLHYHTGIPNPARMEFLCGDVMSVLDGLDESYSSNLYGHSLAKDMPFVILLKSFNKALGAAIADREAKVATQKSLQDRLGRAIGFVSDK